MADRRRQGGALSDRADDERSEFQEIAADLGSVDHDDASERLGQRRLMETLSFCQASATVGRQVASGARLRPATAPSPSEGTGVTTIEPRPRLVACTVSFVSRIGANLVESLSGALRETYPHVAPRRLGERQVFYSDPDRTWAVWLTESEVGVETSRFREIGELRERLDAVVSSLNTNAGRYRRVGLRSVYHVLSSWNVVPRPLSPDQRHLGLGQVVQWRSQGEQSVFDLDVFAQNVDPASLEEHLEEIFQASRPLSVGHGTSTAGVWRFETEPERTATLWTEPATVVAAYPELVPFEAPLATEVSDVEVLASERADLLARKHGGEPLSLEEQERLDSLTARLDELLPPISPHEIASLVKMAQEADRVRERARERRKRLEAMVSLK